MKLNKPFLVYTGNLYPHKNVGLLVQVAEKMGINLAIVCSRSVFENRLPKSTRVHFLGRLSDQELLAVYKQATAFVLPSFIEGFGLTGLEAMAAGLPVISSNASCLPEIYGEAALYFDPHSAQELEEKIKLILNDKKLADQLRKKGLVQIKKYSWVKMAKETWQIYQTELQ